MILLVNLGLACGVAYLGARTLRKRKTTDRKSWLARSNRRAKRRLLPLSTRIYIVRVWEEQGQRAEQSLTRYALTVPSSGARCGFNSPEALLETLSMELTKAQNLPLSAGLPVAGV